MREEFKLLLRAVRFERPRIVLIQYNHYDLVRQTLQEIKAEHPERSIYRFDFSKEVPSHLSKAILACQKGFVLLEHFEQLFDEQHQTQVRTFNQRRDAFSMHPLILLIFLPLGLEYLKIFRTQLPDIYSLINPIVQLQQATESIATQISRAQRVENLEGTFNSAADAQEEIVRLSNRLANLEDIANNVDMKARLQNDLALAYQFIGRYEEAAYLLKNALQSALDNLGEQHPNVAARQSNLANVYKSLGRYEEAANLLESALQSDLDNFGEQHPNIATRQSNLANVYSNLGRYKEAASLLESALQSDLDNFGKQHPSVAVSQSNLALVYSDLGRNEEAVNLLESALQSDLNNFGEQHPNVAVSQLNLANVYGDLGRNEEAANLLESALQSTLDNFGEQHPNVAVIQLNLATVYGDLGRYEEAASLLESALQSDL
ncbi:MAG: tetratricopeptide repeat protein, partial [Bacteroidota bacterium]